MRGRKKKVNRERGWERKKEGEKNGRVGKSARVRERTIIGVTSNKLISESIPVRVKFTIKILWIVENGQQSQNI